MKLETDQTNLTLQCKDGAIIFRDRNQSGKFMDIDCYVPAPKKDSEEVSDIAFTVSLIMWLLNSSDASVLLSTVIDAFNEGIEKQRRKAQKCQ